MSYKQVTGYATTPHNILIFLEDHNGDLLDLPIYCTEYCFNTGTLAKQQKLQLQDLNNDGVYLLSDCGRMYCNTCDTYLQGHEV
jgi:hypothetical protein